MSERLNRFDRDFFVQWDQATHAEVDEFAELIRECDEHAVQAFFASHRHFLVEHLRGGHGRWVIPQKRLGSEFVPDFLIGERHSFGVDWVAVELESPKARLFTKAGDPSATLNHAIRQIMDWREWLTLNLDYASRPLKSQGLGLKSIRPDLEGLILIGRRATLSEASDSFRSQAAGSMRINIHTYDYVVDRTRAKAALFARYARERQAKLAQSMRKGAVSDVTVRS